MKNRLLSIHLVVCMALIGCKEQTAQENNHFAMQDSTVKEHKKVVYQVFTRLFGNTNTNNKAWGTLEENGVGKFADFTDKALQEIKALGVTHIWYTGVPHHALITDYADYGLEADDPDVVKGRAGSPYAVKDYYNVNPDLAMNPKERLEEFKALIERTHRNGLKLIIDIVPNHVARRYKGMTNPEGVVDFGARDNTTLEYHRDNNFYYIPGTAFEVPEWRDGYRPLGGEAHSLADGKFEEVPAKWTGNGSRNARPDMHDWYETVKVNYGVRPDGTKDFETLPQGYDLKPYQEHFSFWQDKDVPDSWEKFRDIALYWLEMGVDGFRFDMAEMVPVEFWSYMNSAIKMKNPDAFLLAEVYNPSLYRDYIRLGKMDYLYDKVELYDTLKHVMQGYGLTRNIPPIQEGLRDIEHHMLHFLENHDEQRIASPEFAGNALKGKPAMVVSATISTSPTMIYFGQEVGEPGALDSGFGKPSRTTIFDYAGVPEFQKWVNGKAFDGQLLSEEQKQLRDFYRRLLNFTLSSEALMGEYQELHTPNLERASAGYSDKQLAYARWSEGQKLLVIANFEDKPIETELFVPSELLGKWGLNPGTYTFREMLYGADGITLIADEQGGRVKLSIPALGSLILELQ